MRYHALGTVPRKRHAQTRANGAGSPLLVEEVMGYEGFSGNESILYHRHSPCRVAEVGEFTPIVLEEWVPDTHVHRLTNTAPVQPGGDTVFGRQVLMFNGDVEMGIAKPDPAFFARCLELMGAPAAGAVAYVGDRIDNDVIPAIT